MCESLYYREGGSGVAERCVCPAWGRPSYDKMGRSADVDWRCAGDFRRYRGQHTRDRNWAKNGGGIDPGAWRARSVAGQPERGKKSENTGEIAERTPANFAKSKDGPT